MVKDEAVGGVDAELGFLASDAETTASWRHCSGWAGCSAVAVSKERCCGH